MKSILTLIAVAILALLTAVNAQADYIYGYSTTLPGIIRYDSTDLGSYTHLNSGLGGFIDIAVDSKYIYAADGNYIRKMDINTGESRGISHSQALNTVTVLRDGTVIGKAGSNLLYAYDPENLKSFSQWTPTLYGGITDMAGGDDVLYAITGGMIYRIKSDGTAIHTDNHGLTTVAVLPDGNVAAYNGSAIRVYNGETLEYSHSTVSGVGGFIDMAAGADGIFTVDGSRVRNYPIAGGHAVDASPIQSVNSVAYQFIPEPATMSLLSIGALAMLKRRKRK